MLAPMSMKSPAVTNRNSSTYNGTPVVPDRLQAVVHDSLNQDPAKRYPSASEMREDLAKAHEQLSAAGVGVYFTPSRPTPTDA